MKTQHYLLTALAVYLALLIYLAPAAPIVNLLIKDNKQISATSITGTLWSGKAKSIRINNIEFIDTQWNFTVWRLLTAKLSFAIDTSYKNNPLSSNIGLSMSGNYFVKNLTTTLNAFEAGKIAELPIGELDGRIDVQIDAASWASGTAPEISGNIFWKKAAYIVSERAELGDLTVRLGKSDTAPLSVDIENISGHLSIKGNIAVDDTGHYTLGIILQPTKDASNNLRNSLKLFAKPVAGGNFEINNAGELSSLGFM